MSGLYLLALIAIWLFVGWVFYRFWRRWQAVDMIRKVIHIVIGIMLFSVWFGGAFWEVAGKKMYWDTKVGALCAKDGGIKVYETVELPAEMFNQWGQPKFYGSDIDEILFSKYLLKEETQFLRTENQSPTILRHHFRFFRRTDGQLLGEQISYARRGGDLPGPWHLSSYSCPNFQGKGLLDAVFIHQIQKTEGVNP